MAIFGGEKARKEETEQSYVDKYPLSNSLDSLQKTIGLANIELVGLRNSQPSTSGAKRIRQRNITALSNRLMQLNNKIIDLRSGVSSAFGGLVIAPPVMAKLPTVTSDSLLRKTPYSLPMPILTPASPAKPIVPQNTDVRDLADAVETTDGTPVDAEPMGAQGDYPPPEGVQGSGMTKMLLYGGLAVAVAVTAYFLYKKKK
jgi:hypothetical protein